MSIDNATPDEWNKVGKEWSRAVPRQEKTMDIERLIKASLMEVELELNESPSDYLRGKHEGFQELLDEIDEYKQSASDGLTDAQRALMDRAGSGCANGACDG